MMECISLKNSSYISLTNTNSYIIFPSFKLDHSFQSLGNYESGATIEAEDTNFTILLRLYQQKNDGPHNQNSYKNAIIVSY